MFLSEFRNFKKSSEILENDIDEKVNDTSDILENYIDERFNDISL